MSWNILNGTEAPEETNGSLYVVDIPRESKRGPS
jgi:hypothetical protein